MDGMPGKPGSYTQLRRLRAETMDRDALPNVRGTAHLERFRQPVVIVTSTNRQMRCLFRALRSTDIGMIIHRDAGRSSAGGMARLDVRSTPGRQESENASICTGLNAARVCARDWS
jgi:hypothetical protein